MMKNSVPPLAVEFSPAGAVAGQIDYLEVGDSPRPWVEAPLSPMVSLEGL
jgi:hypothetical protein